MLDEEIWLRTDEREDILASLRMVSSSCDTAIADPSAWKWIVIGSHSALQGVMTLHLGFGNDLLVASPEDANAWLDAHDNGTPYPDMMMDGFLCLYRKIKKHEIFGYLFKPSGTQGGSIRRLNRLRNQFTHFMPKGWSVELGGMPGICIDCLDVADQIAKNSLCNRWESDHQKNSFEETLGQCQSKLHALQVIYTR